MKLQVTITRTDSGANTHVKSHNGEANRDYASWSEALNEASSLGLINSVEAVAAHAMPPGLPFHTDAEAEPKNLKRHGFKIGKASPPE
jgi:hypothetical protein